VRWFAGATIPLALLLASGAAGQVDPPRTSGSEPVARAWVWAALEERDLVAEGTAYDPATRSVLVGSLNKAKVVAIAEDGAVSDRVRSGSSGLASVAGIHVDGRRGVLWVTSNARYDDPSDTRQSQLFAFDAASGRFIERYAAPAAGANFFNDITTGPDGTVYLTDSRADEVWRLRPGAAALEPLGPDFSGPNGITICDEGDHLFVADGGHIVAIALDGGGATWRLPAPDTIDVRGIDGLAFAADGLIAHHPLEAWRVVRYELAATHRAITGRTVFEAGTPDSRTSTTGEVVGDEYVFIGNGQLDRMNDGTIDTATMEPIRMYRIGVQPSPDGRVVVALSGTDSVAVFDAQTLERAATVQVGRSPHEVTAAPDGRRAYVANTSDPTVDVLEVLPSPRRVARWTLPDAIRAHDVAVHGESNAVWAASGDPAVLVELDAATGRARRTVPLTLPGSWMLESARGRDIVVAHLEGGAVTLIDPGTGGRRTFAARTGEIDARFTPDGTAIWSVNAADGAVTVFDPATGRVVDRVSAGGDAGRIVFTPDGATALVVSTGAATVSAFDVRTRQRRSVVELAPGPKVIALSRDGRRAYVTHPEIGALTLIDVPAMTLLRRVAVPGAPDGVAVLERAPGG
jgi:YVTN family beta-propeller protein